jgi:hypothetical protein
MSAVCHFLLLVGGASLTTDISFRRFVSHYPYIRLLSLSALWVLGLLIGFGFVHFGVTPSYSWMLSAVTQPMSIVGLFITAFLPFLITYFSCVSNKYSSILLICFFKAIAFSYTWTIVAKCFGSATWVITFLYMFSDLFSLVLLFYIWVNHFVGTFLFKKHTYFMCISILSALSFTDYFVIAPLLQSLF